MKPLPPKLWLAFIYMYFALSFLFFVTINRNFKVVLRPSCNPPSCHPSSISSRSMGRHPSVSLTPASGAKNSRDDAVEQDVQPAVFVPVFVLVLLAWAEACPPPSSLLALLGSLGEFVRFNLLDQVCCGLAYTCFSCILQYRQLHSAV